MEMSRSCSRLRSAISGEVYFSTVSIDTRQETMTAFTQNLTLKDLQSLHCIEMT